MTAFRKSKVQSPKSKVLQKSKVQGRDCRDLKKRRLIGLRSTASDLDLGPWTLDLGPWTLALRLGLWTLDLGPWTSEGPRTSDSFHGQPAFHDRLRPGTAHLPRRHRVRAAQERD